MTTTTTEETALDLEALRQGYPARYLSAPPRAGKCCRPAYDVAASQRRMRLWALVTEAPAMPIRAMSRALGVPFTTVRGDLAALEDGGYIQLGPKHSKGARVVLIPCYTVRRP